jgi:hypothetical protein
MTSTPGHSSYQTRKYYKRSASILYIVGQIDYFPGQVWVAADPSVSENRTLPGRIFLYEPGLAHEE